MSIIYPYEHYRTQLSRIMDREEGRKMNLIIRKANILDARDIAIVHIRSWIAAYSGIVPYQAIAAVNGGRLSLWQKILKNDSDAFVGVCNHEIAGFVGMSESRDDDAKPDTYEIAAFYLVPEYFGKGIAKPMMDYVLEHIKKLGYSSVTLWTLEENTRARKFYEKCGFLPEFKKEITIGKPLIEIRYKKDLST